MITEGYAKGRNVKTEKKGCVWFSHRLIGLEHGVAGVFLVWYRRELESF